MGSFESFLRAIRHQAEAPAARPAIVAPRVEFETFETSPSNPSVVAGMITKAAKHRDAGGEKTPKPSAVAQQILDAGRRRGEVR